jgi:hypothetical protein
VGSFASDDAADWLLNLEEVEAIAAAEVVAAAVGRPSSGLPDSAARWVARHPGAVRAAVRAKALAAVRRVADRSETRELWHGSGDFDEWRAMIDDLSDRLAAR